MRENVILQTDLPGLTLLNRGKVRDIYDLGEHLLIVATDRISAFDSVLGSGIPYKGKVLTGLSEFWFNYTSDVAPNHFITADIAQMGESVQQHAQALTGRSMLVKRAEVIPIECVVRGYLAGSGWAEYQKSQSICGIELPTGLREADKLPRPIFTPATKAETGHDENISFEQAAEIAGEETASRIRENSLALYQKASEYALGRGIIISDTKFEWGYPDDTEDDIILIDEVLTPDSSRFWLKETYAPGQSQLSFDKQFVRDYLNTTGWNKQPPAPALPDDVIDKTTEKYLEAYRKITGKELDQ